MTPNSNTNQAPRETPAYRADVFAPKKHRYCVVVFVLNEGERIRRQLSQMSAFADLMDIIIADGGSTDGSLDPERLSEWQVRAILTKTGPGRLSAQMRMAFSWATEEGYEGVIVIDGSDKDGLEALPNFITLLDEGYDHIQGSRFVPGGRAINTPIGRLLGLRLLHAPLITLAAGERHTDTTNGFRAYSRTLLQDDEIAIYRDIFDSYQLHYHLAIEASRISRFRTIETPVARVYPAKGPIPTKITPLRGNLHVFGVLIMAAAGRYRYQPHLGGPRDRSRK